MLHLEKVNGNNVWDILKLTVSKSQKNLAVSYTHLDVYTRQVEYGKDYDVVNNPDIFELYIDGKEVKE